MLFMRKTTALPSAAEALPGRAAPIPTASTHFVNHRSLLPPYPAGLKRAVFGLGCFWGAERKFWELGSGILITAVGYAGGHTPNPTYEEVCSGRTGHTEVVLVVFDPRNISYQSLLKPFSAKGLGTITTEIAPSGEFYFAEDYHQQYLAKNPAGYCGLGGTGVSCPIGAGVSA